MEQSDAAASPPDNSGLSKGFLSMSQGIGVNPSTGQFQLSIGDTRYDVVPGSVAEQDLLDNGEIVSECLINLQRDDLHSIASEIIGARLGGIGSSGGGTIIEAGEAIEQAEGGASTTEQFEIRIITTKEEGKKDRDTTIRPVEETFVFKKPAIPAKYTTSPPATSAHSVQNRPDYNSIISSIETVFKGYKLTELEEDEESGVTTHAIETIVEAPEVEKVKEEKAETETTDNKNLPHKKRIPKTLKRSARSPPSPPLKTQNIQTCSLCSREFEDQKEFFVHLKEHYEPSENEKPSVVELSESPDVVTKTRSGRVSKPKILRSFVMIKEDEEKGQSTVPEEERRCPVCKETFTSKSSLYIHVRKMHPKTSKSSSKKGASQSTNGLSSNHPCKDCGKNFNNKSSLTVHMRIHDGEKPFKCEHCGRTFRQQSDLKYHTQSIHSIIKEYQCEYCGKEFSRKYSLQLHTKIHTGVKDYVCDFCEKSFRAAIYLQVHRRIHTGERPFGCDVCGKRFRIRADMRRHRFNVHLKQHKQSQAVPQPQPSSPPMVDDYVIVVEQAPESEMDQNNVEKSGMELNQLIGLDAQNEEATTVWLHGE